MPPQNILLYKKKYDSLDLVRIAQQCSVERNVHHIAGVAKIQQNRSLLVTIVHAVTRYDIVMLAEAESERKADGENSRISRAGGKNRNTKVKKE